MTIVATVAVMRAVERGAGRTAHRPRRGEVVEQRGLDRLAREGADLRREQVAHAQVAIERIGRVGDARVLQLGQRHRAHEVVGVDQQSALGMDLEGLVGRALEVDGHAADVADHHVVGRRLRRHVDRAHRERDVLALENLAADECQRHAELPVVAVRLEVVGGDGDARGVEAGAREPARLGEREEIGAVVAPHAQDDGGLGALGFPVPVLRVDQPAGVRGLRQRHHAGAAVGRLGARPAARGDPAAGRA